MQTYCRAWENKFFLSIVCLVCPCVFLSISMSVCMSLCQSVSLSLCACAARLQGAEDVGNKGQGLSVVCLFICQSVCLSVYPSVCLYKGQGFSVVYLFICQSLSLSICQLVCQSDYVCCSARLQGSGDVRRPMLWSRRCHSQDLPQLPAPL